VYKVISVSLIESFIQLWDPPSLLSRGYREFSARRVRRPGREAKRSTPSSAEFKNASGYNFNLQ